MDTIAAAGDKLWKELVGNSSILKVSSVQLAFTGIDVAEAGQRSIEGFLKPISSSSSKESGEARVIIDIEQATQAESAINTAGSSDSRNLGNDEPQVNSISYACPRCGKTFELPTVHQSGEGDDQDIHDQLARAKLEHDDYHFAQDLAKQSSLPAPKSSSNNPTLRTTKKRKAESPATKGIEKFFRK